MKTYVIVSMLLYLVLGLWCLLDPVGTSTYLGLGLLNADGYSEYLAVYGGMELGFAAFYAFALCWAWLRPGALVFSACLYAGIASARALSAVLYPIDQALTMLVMEVGLLLWAIWLLRSHSRHSQGAS